MFSHGYTKVVNLWKKTIEVMCQCHLIISRGYMMSPSLVTCDVPLDHLVKVASARSLYCKVTYLYLALKEGNSALLPGRRDVDEFMNMCQN